MKPINHMYGIAAAASLILAAAAACSNDSAGPEENRRPTGESARIINGDFEKGLENWEITSGNLSSVSISDDGCYGKSALRIESSGDEVIKIVQTSEGLADGLYELEFYFRNSGGSSVCHVEANGRMTALQPSEDVWTLSRVRDIAIEDGRLEVSLNLRAEGASSVEFDGLKMKESGGQGVFLKGGDISELSYVEQNGGKYYDGGLEGDCLDILKANGMNLVRLRLYNDPGNEEYEWSKLMPKGISDRADILKLARRAKEKGMQILLSFHYSDYWTNGEDQHIPHEWLGLEEKELQNAVYSFTKEFLEQMESQETAPEYVAIGNEIQAGLLYPYGHCKKADGTSNEASMCALFSSASKAVRDALPDSRIILHLNGAGDTDVYEWFLSLMNRYGVGYDIIGSSYYPFWTGRDATSVCKWAEELTAAFGKDLIFMETGYAWNPTLPDGGPGQLAHNHPYPYEDMTKEGQKNFLLELSAGIKAADSRRVLGYVYWDPIFIETPQKTGWIVGEKNCVSNSTLFDFSGNALSSFYAMRYNN